MPNEIGYEFGWDDTIEKDGLEFVTLPEGDYDFEVIEFERERYTPGPESKLPACNKAVVHLRIEGPEGAAVIKHNLYLHSITEGMLSAFFTAIGQKKKGERMQMNWNAVVGSKGRAKIGIHKWTGNDGEPRTSNEVKKFYEYEAPVKNYQAGRF